jgi:hypothetical protein
MYRGGVCERRRGRWRKGMIDERDDLFTFGEHRSKHDLE